MSQAIGTAREESSGVRVYLLAVYYLLTNALSLTVAFIGLVLVFLGVTLAPEMIYILGIPLPTSAALNAIGIPWPGKPVVSPMIVTWGATLVLLGLFVFGVMWTNRMYSRVVRS